MKVQLNKLALKSAATLKSKNDSHSQLEEHLITQNRLLVRKLRKLEEQLTIALQNKEQSNSRAQYLEGQLKTYEILFRELERQFRQQESHFDKRFENAIKSIASESINWRNQYQDEIGRLISSSTEQFSKLNHRLYRAMKREAFLTEKLKRERIKMVHNVET